MTREQEKQVYEDTVAQAARDAHARMMREPRNRLWLYFKPHGMAFATRRESDEPPAGYEIVTPEHVPMNRDVNGLIAWVRALAQRLPIYPLEAP